MKFSSLKIIMRSVLMVIAINLLVLAGGIFHDANANISVTERAALIALYNSTNGNNWGNNSGWKTPPLDLDGFAMSGTENNWYGITCDGGNTTVIRIGLLNNGLNGTIPTELGNLTNLTELWLAQNQLTGNIPTELGNLTNLTSLYLIINQLSGSIPTELGNLTNLTSLSLGVNQLTGSIPTELGNLTNLTYLDLSVNQLTGSIPTELANLTNLRYLYLSGNPLGGNILTELSNLTNLTILYLSSNQLTGRIPTELANLTNLTILDLSSNQLTGSIPTELANLTSLQALRLFTNQLTGSIPTELSNLTNLITLYLFNNQLSGSIPTELSNLTNLTYLYLENNQLSGSIPSELGNLTNLTALRLNSNQLTGAIPLNLTNLTNLSLAEIGYNALYASDEALTAFLNSVDADWHNSQTLAPTNLTAVTTETAVVLSWTPATYTADGGGYEIYMAESGGASSLIGTTTDKSIDSYIVYNLNPETTYTFKVRTKTDIHLNNQNVVYSEFSDDVVITIAAFVAGKGDINGDGSINLSDVILALQVIAGFEPNAPIFKDADVNGDGRIGLEEAINALQKVAGIDTAADDAAIRAVFAAMKTAVEAHKLTDVMSLYATDYINNGTDRDTVQSELTNGIPTVSTFVYTISNIIIAGTKAAVYVSVTVTFNDGQPPITFTEPSETDGGLGMGYLTKTNGQWLIFGNQRRGKVNVPTYLNEDGSYSFRITAVGENLTTVTVSGPNIQPTILSWDDGWEEFNAWVTPSHPPHVGDVYSLNLTYADGYKETLTDTIKSLVTVAPRLTATIGSNNTINLSWTDISTQVPSADHYWILVYGPDGYKWHSTNLNLSRTSAIVNEDGTANGLIVQGKSYSCTLYLYDKFGDASASGVNVTIP